MTDQEEGLGVEFDLEQAKERLAKLEELVEGLIECAGVGNRVKVPVLEEWVQARRELKSLAAARTSPSRPA